MNEQDTLHYFPSSRETEKELRREANSP